MQRLTFHSREFLRRVHIKRRREYRLAVVYTRTVRGRKKFVSLCLLEPATRRRSSRRCKQRCRERRLVYCLSYFPVARSSGTQVEARERVAYYIWLGNTGSCGRDITNSIRRGPIAPIPSPCTPPSHQCPSAQPPNAAKWETKTLR